MRFFKGTAAERASSSKTGESGDLVIESDTGKVAVADGTNTLGDLQLLARANEVTAAQAAAAADATTKANAAQSAATTAAATDATAKAAAARAGAVTDVTTDITGGTGPVATALTASTADSIEPGETDPQTAVDTRVETVGATLFEGTPLAQARAARNAAAGAAFAPIQQALTPARSGLLYFARAGNDYSFHAGRGGGRYGSFFLPRFALSLNSVTYTTNCLNGCSIDNAMLSVDDTAGTFAGSGTWTTSATTAADVGYLLKNLVVSTVVGSTVTITSGTITAADVGRKVVIAGAGVAGADLVTTISVYYNSTTFGAGTPASSAGSGRAATVWATYRYNATAGGTATWVTPANTTSVGIGIVLSQNGGLCKVGLVGASVGAVTPSLCVTAQYAVDHLGYSSSILVANGGSLNPTDPVIDCNSHAALDYFDVRRSIADGLTADTYTLTLTVTGYQPTGGTGARVKIDRFAYGLASTTAATSGAQIFRGHDMSPGFPSAWELAFEGKPHSGSTWTYMCQAAHQLEDQQTFTIKLDDATATPADGSLTACRSAEVTRTTKIYHPDSGAALASNPLALGTYVYRLDRLKLATKVRLVFQIETDVRNLIVMMPLINRQGAPAKIDKAALEACPDIQTMSGSGSRLGSSRSAFAFAWDSTGKVAAAMYIPDHYGFTSGYVNTLDGTYVEDRVSPIPASKIYAPAIGINQTRTFAAGEVFEYEVHYMLGYFADANAVMAAL